jgi:hypothetical protein
VGDYTRTLAEALAAQGHTTVCASLRDASAPETALTADRKEARWRDVFLDYGEESALAAWLRDFRPDWVSVQFTPFGFHPRGLGAARARRLREMLPAGARRHLMLHEIWLEPGPQGPWRHRFLGWWQRRSVDAWTGAGWQPEVVHTQARLHQARLQARGVDAELLPLCSTFARPEMTPAAARGIVSGWLGAAGPSLDENGFWFGHFGSFHPHWNFPEFAARMAKQSSLLGKRAGFLAMGRSPAAAAAWAEAARAAPDADFRVVGELPVEKISIAMHACDLAFTGTPWDIIEKSATVAAWRALGIPVLAPRAGAVAASELPFWPDAGLRLADGSEKISLQPFERVAGPAYLDPAHTARAFLAALEKSPRRRP